MKPIEFEELETRNSGKIGFINVICLLLFMFPLMNSSIHPASLKKYDNMINTTSNVSHSNPIAIIDYHTSRETFYRIHYLWMNYWLNNSLLRKNVFKIRIVYSNMLTINLSELLLKSRFPIEIITVNSSDSIKSLSFRVDCSYKSFLNQNQSLWLYRATDDAFINFDNLYEYIQYLNQFYDPGNELVVRAHANFELKSNYFIHGGPGYLMSRSYVQYHFDRNYTLHRLENYSKYNQDDTAESIILHHIYDRSYRQWDEFYIDGFQCSNCQMILRYNFSELPKCPPNKRIGQFSKLIAIHMFGMMPSQLVLIDIIKNKQKEVSLNHLYYYNHNENQSIVICTSKFGRSEIYNLNNHGKITGNQLANRQIDFKKLVDQYNNYNLFEIKY